MLDTKLLGPFTSVWVGIAETDTSPPFKVVAPPWGSGVLVKIPTRRKDGGFLVHRIPEKVSEAFNEDLPDGMQTLELKLTFKQDSLIVQNIMYGRDLDNSDINAPAGNNRYTLLLISRYPDDKVNYIIPICKPKKEKNDNRQKNEEQRIELSLFWQDNNHYNKLFIEETVDELSDLLDTRSPV